MDGRRRASSLGKGFLKTSSSVATRSPLHPDTRSMASRPIDGQNRQVVDEDGQRSRATRSSMRRMVRFRMSAPDIDPSIGVSQTAVSRQAAWPAFAQQPSGSAAGDRCSGSAASARQSQCAAAADNRPAVVVHQVSRFSVMQTPIHETLQQSSSVISSTASSDCNERQNHRDRRRTHTGNPRNHRSRNRARRQNRNSASSSTTSGSRGSTPERPTVRSRRRRNRNGLEGNVDPDEESRRRHLGVWPHKASALFAMLATTVGVFNISRFALLSIAYGGTFIIQFVLLTLVFGIPLLCFSACLGQFLGSGAIDMWKISPIFKGVGVALLLSQAVVGVYSAVSVSWMFFYFRDSFIAPEERFRWDKCSPGLRNCTALSDYTLKPEQTIPDYFHGRVLQRNSISEAPSEVGNLKFEVCFNLAVIWIIVFVALSRGLRTYGKVTYALGTFPFLSFLVVCVKLLGTSSNYGSGGSSSDLDAGQVLGQTAWNEFFTNTKVWVAAGREVFLTWGLFGAVVMQICAHNRYQHKLRRDICVVASVTLLVLLLSGFLGSACLNIIYAKQGYVYVPSSFESGDSITFLQNEREFREQLFTESRDHLYNNFISGISIVPKDRDSSYGRSYYQPVRLATEIFPAVMSILGPSELSPFWSVLFYFSLVSFGIAQQLAIWFCVINGIVSVRACCLKSWQMTITFCTCAVGYLLCLPMATEVGISVVYFLDYAIGSAWWMMLIYVIEIAAVVVVRGRHYNSESIVAVLVRGSSCLSVWCNPLLAFSWNAALPAGLIVLSIASFNVGNYVDLFSWDPSEGYAYWPVWARQCGCVISLVPLLLVPIGGIIQSVRYLRKEPYDFFEKIKLLYRPDFRTYIVHTERGESSRSRHDQGRERRSRSRSRSLSPRPQLPDPPPKYTPPPTYNTATGARIAKLFRESIRRIRDFATPTQTPLNTVTSMAELELGQPRRDDHQMSVTSTQRSLPPAYTSVIMEIVRSGRLGNVEPERQRQLSSDGSENHYDSTNATTTSIDSTDTGSHLTAAEITRLLLRESCRRNNRRQSPGSVSRGNRTYSADDTDGESTAETGSTVSSPHEADLQRQAVSLPNCSGGNHESIA